MYSLDSCSQYKDQKNARCCTDFRSQHLDIRNLKHYYSQGKLVCLLKPRSRKLTLSTWLALDKKAGQLHIKIRLLVYWRMRDRHILWHKHLSYKHRSVYWTRLPTCSTSLERPQPPWYIWRHGKFPGPPKQLPNTQHMSLCFCTKVSNQISRRSSQ